MKREGHPTPPADEAFATGDPETDGNHNALALLLERVVRICCESSSQRRDCGACPDERIGQCRDSLGDIAAELMTIMLSHFHHEGALMAALEPTPAVKKHCEQHRRAHVEFSTRYNATIASLDRHGVAENARKLENLLCDWVRTHALGYEYDSVLADLREAAHVR